MVFALHRLYAMAAHTEVGPLYGEVMDEKRQAMLNHLIGIHVHPGHVHYTRCTHPESHPKRMDRG